MDSSLNSRLARLEVLVGQWELTASIDERVMTVARATIEWLGDRGGLLVVRADPPTFIVPEWVGAAPEWTQSVIGADDYSDTFAMLYADSRGVSRRYEMTLDAGRWTMASRPGEEFHQRFVGTFDADQTAIDARWEASVDGETWTTDFDVAYRRLDEAA
jgi:hypothetical protein